MWVQESRREAERQSEVSGFLSSPDVDFDQNNALRTRARLTGDDLWRPTCTRRHTRRRIVFLKKHRLPHTCISQQLVVSLQHRQVGSAPALCPSLCAPPDPTPVSVLPKPHLTSWDNRWKASWERAASVTCWPDMDWHNSWGYNLLSADRRTESSVWKLLYDWNKRGVSGFKFAQWTRVTPL